MSEAGGSRVEVAAVVRSLAKVLRHWPVQPVEVGPQVILVAGCAERIADWQERSLDELEVRVREILGEEYTDGFVAGFNCVAAAPMKSLRFVQGLDDGGVVGRAVRWGEVEE